MPFIYSTLTCSNFYAIFAPKSDAKELSTIVKRIEIKGGNGVAQYIGQMASYGVLTPKGTVTEVSEADLILLEQNLAFRRHRDRGFLVVDTKKVNPEKRAKEMTEKDKSAQIVPSEFVTSEESGRTTFKRAKREPLL